MNCPECLSEVQISEDILEAHRDRKGNPCFMSGRFFVRWDERFTREAVVGRSGGVCERCNCARATDMHHRISRGVGGKWSPANIVHLCRLCHTVITANPEDAYKDGWSLPHGSEPNTIAVKRSVGWLQPSDNVAPPRRRR
jgi:hypothetical protein